jgi:diguanylate cyclase (GGDEF)-like protein
MPEERTDSRPAVLLAIENNLERARLKAALDGASLRVIEAHQSRHVNALYQAENPMIIVLDGTSAGAGGFSACGLLRQEADGENIPVLMVIDADDLAAAERAFEVGATDIAQRPVNPEMFALRLRYVLRASRWVEALRDSREQLSAAHQIGRMAHWEWDLRNDHFHFSSSPDHALNFARGNSPTSLRDLIASIPEDDRARVRAALEKALREGASVDIDHRILLPDGVVREVRQCVRVLSDKSGEAARMVATVQDVTESKQAEACIAFLSNYDSLTHLPNRDLFLRLADDALVAAARSGDSVAVLIVNLDRFKLINGSLGHRGGDLILRGVARRLLKEIDRFEGAVIPAGDAPPRALARLGSDEFAILMPRLNSAEAGARFAQAVKQTFDAPFTIGDHEVFVTAHTGIVLAAPGEAAGGEALIRNASLALRHAKAEKSRTSYRLYAPTMTTSATGRLTLEAELHRALAGDELTLFYQPQVDIRSGRIVGVEALVRWHHPNRGLMRPGAFIGLADESGLIPLVGAWVLAQSCAQSRQWRKAGLAPLKISVNLSSEEFRLADVVDLVAGALRDNALDARYLEVEVTESFIMRDLERSLTAMAELKKIGVDLAIDDFGTGYSSLSYLKQFPVDKIKIDKSFIDGLAKTDDAAALTRAMIEMSHSLGLSVIAEGVETLQQLDILRAQQCDQYQGFLFSRPLPAGELEAALKTSGL